MGSWMSLLPSLIFGDIDLKVARYKRNAGLSLLALVFFGTAYVFLLIMAGMLLSIAYGPVMAMAILGCGSLALGLILIGVMMAFSARDRRLAAERRRRSAAAGNLAIAAGLTLFRRNPLLALGAVIAIGTVAGFVSGKPREED